MNMRKLMEAVDLPEPVDPFAATEGKPQYGPNATYMLTYYKDTHDDYMKRWGYAPVAVTDLGKLTEYLWPDYESMTYSTLAGAKPLRSK